MRHYVMLAAPNVGLLHGTLCANRKTAAVLLSDRLANGEAFPGEFVVRVPRPTATLKSWLVLGGW